MPRGILPLWALNNAFDTGPRQRDGLVEYLMPRWKREYNGVPPMKVRSFILRTFILFDVSSLSSPPSSDFGLPESSVDYAQSIAPAQPKTRLVSPWSTRLVLLFCLLSAFVLRVASLPRSLTTWALITMRAASYRSCGGWALLQISRSGNGHLCAFTSS